MNAELDAAAKARREAVEKLGPWTHHNSKDCYSYWDKDARCPCGLDEVLKELKGEQDE